MSDRLEDKFYKLNIEAELSVSILSGLVKVSGSAQFLNEKRTTAKKSCMSLIYNVATRSEIVILRQLKNKINFDSLDTDDATHILTGIEWGAACTVTAEYEFSDGDEKKEIEGCLKAELNKLKGLFDAKGEAKVDFNEAMKAKEANFKFYSKCDVGGRADDLPITFDEAVLQAKKLPSLVEATNAGKGVPIKFVFTPLEIVRRWFKLESRVNVIYRSIQEETLKRVVQLSQSMTETSQKLNDLKGEIMAGGQFCVSNADIQTVVQMVNDFNLEQSRFHRELQGLLEDIRSSKKEVTELEKLISGIECSRFSVTAMDAEMAKWQSMKNKIATILKLQGKGISYYGKAGQPDHFEKEEMFVYHAKNLLLQDDNFLFFLKLKECMEQQQKDVAFCIIDLAINPNVETGQTVADKIFHFKAGRQMSADYKSECLNGCLITFNEKAFEQKAPLNKAKVYLKCPGNVSQETRCSSDEKEWICGVCRSPIWYGIETKKFHCEKCQKKCAPNKAAFRCDEEDHGFFSLSYPAEPLQSGLSMLRESYNINILILGETGVGKSTWINSFANYLYFSTLDEAIQGNKECPVVAIPSQFTVHCQGQEQVISIGGNDANEVHDVGASNTQEARTYPFKVGKYTVNLIDTPGIGDTRGIQQDDSNMEGILSHLTFYKEIHVILILLKPNNARLGIFFKHCIQQLLAHLHKDAARNIAFVFTNTRSTFYEPGETLPSLRKLLLEKQMGIEAVNSNIFCFDNEAFRFLACTLQGVNFPPDVTADFEKSWEKACKETQRLLKFTHNLSPHKVFNTISLNDARRIIVSLSRPLQEFAEVIKKNIKQMEDQKSQAESFGKDAQEFASKLKFDGITLEQKTLGFPRTVCTHDNCVEFVPCGKDNITQKNYKTWCHEHCGLGGSVRPEVVGDERLMGCAAMNGNNVCNKCGHSYNIHMHRTYDMVKVKKEFISTAVQEKIDRAKTEKQKAEMRKQEFEKLVTELKEEEVQIRDIGAGFAAFLKTFAIIPFNDAMGDYIEAQIKDEQTKLHPDKRVIAELQKQQDQYETRKEIITKAMSNVKNTDVGKSGAAEEIKRLEQKAYGLKHFGKDIKAAIDKINTSKAQLPEFHYGNIPKQPKRAKKRKFLFWEY